MTTMYLECKALKGPVTAEGFADCIEVESFHFGTKRQFNTQPGKVMNREGSRPSISEVTITKRVDETTPLFFSESVVGKAQDKMTITFVTTGGDKLQEYMVYELENVFISGYDISETQQKDSSDDQSSLKPLETITLSFDQIEVKYIPYDGKNQMGSPIPAGYSLVTAQAA